MLNISKTTLPSNGLLGYEKEISVRALKVKEVANLYVSNSDASVDAVIKEIISPALDLSVVCDEDKWYILHQARVLSMGNTVELKLKCPHCGNIHNYTVDYNDLSLRYLTEESLNEVVVVNDINGKEHKITKRVITNDRRQDIDDYRRRYNPPQTEALIWNIASKISTLDNKNKTVKELVDFILDLPAKELNKLMLSLNLDFGLDTTYTVECPERHLAFTGGLAFTAELF